ncbi:MAG: helix-turn-helix transcriptional regulator [Bacteroidota bacterium]
MHLAQNINHLRTKNKLSQSELGNRLGITGNQIGRYEKGTSDPPVSKLIQMADLFQVNVQDLLFTDLSSDTPKFQQPEIPYTQQDESSVVSQLNTEMRKRLVIYEQKIKELDPDLAKDWGIE